MKIYLDDIRVEPEGWVRTYTAHETIVLLKNNDVEEISLDHDLGNDEEYGTGYDVLLWIEEQVFTSDYKPPKMKVHSANPIGVERMELLIQRIIKKGANNG